MCGFGTGLLSGGMRFLVRFSSIAFLLLCAGLTNGAEGDYFLATAIGGTGEASGEGVGVDAAGNIYTAGSFEGTVDFDPGAGVQFATSGGDYDTFVSKLDGGGAFLWVRTFGGTTPNDGAYPQSMDVDAEGNVYIAGEFEGTVDLDPGDGAFEVVSPGVDSGFLSMIDTYGTFVWGISLPLSSGFADIVLDDVGNVYLTGSFSGTVDFDFGPGVFEQTSAGLRDIFILKLDANGSFVWVKTIGGIGYDGGEDLAVDANGILHIMGTFEDRIDFDPGAGEYRMSGYGGAPFLLKLEDNGGFVGVQRLSSSNDYDSVDFALDGTGNVYTTGLFQNTVDFDPYGEGFELTSESDRTIFLSKLDSDGTFAWARALRGEGGDYRVRGVRVDVVGNAYLTGAFRGTVDFDPGAGIYELTSAQGASASVFISKLDSAGEFAWAKGTNGNAASDVSASALALEPGTGHIFVAGEFRGVVDFDPGEGVTELTSAEEVESAFTWKLSGFPNATPPNATTVTPATPGPTNETELSFTIGFDEIVQNFDDVSDLIVTHSGTSSTGAVISGGPGAYTVTLTGVSGEGSLTLAVSTASDVEDLNGNALASSVTSAPVSVAQVDEEDGGDFIWARATEGSDNAQAYDVALDAGGNIYVTGEFGYTTDFDPGEGTYNLTGFAVRNAFVLKLDNNGEFMWAKALRSSIQSVSYSIDVDSQGNVYITGYFDGTMDADPGPGTYNLVSTGSRDIFVSKLSTNGNFVWARGAGGDGADRAFDIAVDASGSVYTTGIFYSMVDFDPGAGIVNRTSAGNGDAFVSKLDSSGNFAWVVTYGGASADRGESVALDGDGNVYATGNYTGVVDFDPGAGVFEMNPAVDDGEYVTKLDSNGALHWAKSLNGTGGINDSVVNAQGEVYLAGNFNNVMSFDTGSGAIQVHAQEEGNIFVAKLNSSGDALWARSLDGPGQKYAYSIALDDDGNVYTTGEFASTIDLDPGLGTVEIAAAGISDGFVSKLDGMGNYVWARTIGGEAAIVESEGIAIAGNGNVHVAGSFRGMVDFDPSLGETFEINSEGRNVFVAKLSPLPIPDGTPEIQTIGDAITPEGEVYMGPLPVLTEGLSPVVWTLTMGPSGIVIDGATGRVTWPNPIAVGTPHTITIRATNSAGYDEESWLLAVTPESPEPPVITLLGTNPVYVDSCMSYTDAGATAHDLMDGDLTSSIVVAGVVDTSAPGEYVITYSVSDSEGSPAVPAARTVRVIAADSDGDGLENCEELSHGYNPLLWDSDGDGVSDGAEVDSALALHYLVIDLGTFGGYSSQGWSINNSGQVVGYALNANGESRAFLYDDGLHDLGTLGGTGSFGYAINEAGDVVGNSWIAGQTTTHAFFYDGTMQDLGTLGGLDSNAYGINDLGHVVGGSRNADGQYHAFFYDGSMHDIGTLGGTFSMAHGVNNAGAITGRSYLSGGSVFRAFLYDGTMHDLGTLGGSLSEADDINDSGHIVGSSFNAAGARRAFFYDGAMHDLGTLGGHASDGNAINEMGQIVGHSYVAGNLAQENAFLYDDALGGMLNLNDHIAPASGWQLSVAQDINDHGYIVGRGYHNGLPRAFILAPDRDRDELSDFDEARLGTNPENRDTDDDGLTDGAEVHVHGTDPLLADTDGDGIPDGVEVGSGTGPLDDESYPSGVYVDSASGSDTSGNGSQASPWATVGHAVASVVGNAENTVTVHVAEGVYTSLNPAGGPLHLDSHEHILGGFEAAGWTRDTQANVTVLDGSVAAAGGPAANVVVLNGVLDAVLDGFTVTGADSSGTTIPDGAGILGKNLDASSAIVDCLVTGNAGNEYGGGGIRLVDASLTITKCVIAGNNTVGQGGGISITGISDVHVDGSIIGANEAAGGGGGVYTGEDSAALITNSVISGNFTSTMQGGGVLLEAGELTIANCTMAHNSADQESGGGLAVLSGVSRVVNTIFANNQHFAIANSTDGTGQILENNLFDGNTGGDYIDRNESPAIAHTGAAAINSQIPGASGNVGGDTAFVAAPADLWTAPPTYNAATDQTTFTDAAAAFTPGALRGQLVVLSPDGFQALVLDNTATTIMVASDYSAVLSVGDPYQFADYRLTLDSAAIDMGRDTSSPVDGGVIEDLDGVGRGFDGDGLGAVTGDASDYDIGAFESNTEVELDTLTVISPNGGESVAKGSLQNIAWSSTGDPGAQVRIIARRGSSTAVIVASTPNDGSYAWLVPTSYPTGSNFKIEINSVTTPAILDASDAFFTVTQAAATGTITVLSPNGGELYAQGASVPISWVSSGMVGSDVEILAHGGGQTVNVITTTPNDGAHNWNVPLDQAPGANYIIEVRSLTTPGITDGSNAPFTITGTPPSAGITVVSPNGGESIARSQVVEILWTSTGNIGANVKILARKGTSFATVTASTANDGSFTFQVPANYPLGPGMYIEISSVTTPSILDVSDGTFTITSTPLTPTITVTTPNGGESYAQGATIPIGWVATGTVGSDVEILAHGAGQTFTVIPSTPNDGVHDWIVPANQAPGASYIVEVRSITSPSITDSSNASFSITTNPSVASITVLYPNGGESIARGEVVDIQWTSTGELGGNVRILARKGTSFAVVANSTANDGSFSYAIPASFPLGPGMTIEISSVTSPAILDSSDGVFTITSTPVVPTITLATPNGGETYVQGATVPITWISAGNVGSTVEILAHGAGQTGTVIASTPNDGMQDWIIPVGQALGSDYTIEVRSIATPNIIDTSNAPFTIAATTPADGITIIAPSGGETFTRGTQVEIAWTSTGTIGANVRIVARKGTTSGVISSSTPNDGTFTWSIPANYPLGPGMYIEISSVTAPEILDVSNGTFTLVAP